MKKILKLIPALGLIAMITSSCSKHLIRGSGSTIISPRVLNSFTSVQTNGDIKVYISYAATQKVEVKGYENLVAITQLVVENNKLNIKYDDKYYNVQNSNIEIYISIPVLTLVGTNGSGDVGINGFNQGISLGATINGSSNINILNSIYDHSDFDINGSGNIRASGLAVKHVTTAIHGSGDIEISCSQALKARIYGSGDIRYWGNPALDVQISGSGTVRKQ